MEISIETTVEKIFPAYIMHQHWDMPDSFNDSLFEIASEDARKNKLKAADDAKNIGDLSNHIGHLRHNFLMDYREHSCVKTLTQMADRAIREYLMINYKYDHKGDIRMMSDTFWQRGSEHNEDTGVITHTHIKSDFVVTYYPRIRLSEDCPDTSLHRGQVRFYDPSGLGKRLWPCNQSEEYIGGWYSLEPKEGSLVVFEGFVPHDSSQFVGGDRMCIPIMCDLDLPNQHCKSSVLEILGEK